MFNSTHAQVDPNDHHRADSPTASTKQWFTCAHLAVRHPEDRRHHQGGQQSGKDDRLEEKAMSSEYQRGLNGKKGRTP